MRSSRYHHTHGSHPQYADPEYRSTCYSLNSSFQADSLTPCDSDSVVDRGTVKGSCTKEILGSAVTDVTRPLKIQRSEWAFRDGHQCSLPRAIVASIRFVQDMDLGMDPPLFQVTEDDETVHW